MEFLSKFYFKMALVLSALVFISPSLYVFAGLPQLGFYVPEPEACPPPWWMWAIIGGLLLPWIPFLLFRRSVIITFDDGVDDRPYQQKYKKGQKIILPDAFHRPGYYVEGWYRSKKYDKRKKWDFGDKIQTSMTLHAKWELEAAPIEQDESE